MKNEFRKAAPSRKAGRRRLLLVFATFLAILLIVVNIGTGGAVGNAARFVASPLWQAGQAAGEAIGESGFFSSRRGLEGEITALEDELQQSQARAAAFSVVQEENQSLSQMTHLAQASPGVTAPVSSSVVSSPYGTFEVGAGSSDGIAPGSLVLSGEGFVLGAVSQVGAHESLVEEIFAPGRTTDVVIDGSPAELTGQGGSDAEAELPNGLTVAPGDPVTAPSLGGKSVGVVGHVTSNPADAQMQVYVTLPVNFSSLQFVYITPS